MPATEINASPPSGTPASYTKKPSTSRSKTREAHEPPYSRQAPHALARTPPQPRRSKGHHSTEITARTAEEKTSGTSRKSVTAKNKERIQKNCAGPKRRVTHNNFTPPRGPPPPYQARAGQPCHAVTRARAPTVLLSGKPFVLSGFQPQPFSLNV